MCLIKIKNEKQNRPFSRAKIIAFYDISSTCYDMQIEQYERK